MDFKESVKYVEFNEQGRICFVGGICTVKDLREQRGGK